MQAEKKRKFVSLPMTQDEYKGLNALLVAVVREESEPTTRADILRDALNMKAVQITGTPIFK